MSAINQLRPKAPDGLMLGSQLPVFTQSRQRPLMMSLPLLTLPESITCVSS